MRCPGCRERVSRFTDEGLLTTGRYTLHKSNGSVIVACQRCRRLVEVRTARGPTMVKVKGNAVDNS